MGIWALQWYVYIDMLSERGESEKAQLVSVSILWKISIEKVFSIHIDLYFDIFNILVCNCQVSKFMLD